MANTERLLSRKEVCEFLNISRSTFYVLMHSKEFPQAVRLTKRCKRWRLEDLQRYVRRRQGQAVEGVEKC